MPGIGVRLLLRAAFRGVAQWTAEAVIGLLPWVLYVSAHTYSRVPLTATCPESGLSAAGTYFGCELLKQTAAPEICILAIVISGLAVLSAIPIGTKHRRITSLTVLFTVVALLSLIFGALFYAFYTVHLDRNADQFTYAILLAALVSSFCLSIEGSLQEVRQAQV